MIHTIPLTTTGALDNDNLTLLLIRYWYGRGLFFSQDVANRLVRQNQVLGPLFLAPHKACDDTSQLARYWHSIRSL